MTSLKPQSLISARAMSLATLITSCILLFLRCLISSWFAFYLSCRLTLSPFCLLRATLCRLLFAPSLFVTLVCIPGWCFSVLVFSLSPPPSAAVVPSSPVLSCSAPGAVSADVAPPSLIFSASSVLLSCSDQTKTKHPMS